LRWRKELASEIGRTAPGRRSRLTMPGRSG
jgi:hypothetical protein